MVRFVIIRHGFSVTNLERRFTGQNNVPLTQLGHSQAREVAQYVAGNYNIDAIFSSDLCRAYDTILPLAEALDMPITKNPAFREVNVGTWQGILVADMEKAHPEKMEAYRNDPQNFVFDGGESHAMAGKRALAALEEIARENDGKTIAVATHGGVIKMIIATLMGVDVKEIPLMPNASVTEIVYRGGVFEIEKMPFDGHLSEKTK